MANLKLAVLIVSILAVVIVDFTQIYVANDFERPILYKFKVFFIKIGSAFVSNQLSLLTGDNFKINFIGKIRSIDEFRPRTYFIQELFGFWLNFCKCFN